MPATEVAAAQPPFTIRRLFLRRMPIQLSQDSASTTASRPILHHRVPSSAASQVPDRILVLSIGTMRILTRMAVQVEKSKAILNFPSCKLYKEMALVAAVVWAAVDLQSEVRSDPRLLQLPHQSPCHRTALRSAAAPNRPPHLRRPLSEEARRMRISEVSPASLLSNRSRIVCT